MNEKQQRAMPPPATPAVDYYAVRCQRQTRLVTSETAVRVARGMARRWSPRWTRFVDIHGQRVWLRTALIECVAECTQMQRARERAFKQALWKEEDEDRRWEDDPLY
jgi:hypothetical protein